MKVRAFHKPDGTVAVMHFAVDDPEIIERDTAAFLTAEPGSTHEDINKETLPSRRFRNCWTKDASKLGGVAVHMDKARAQVLAEVRVKRDAALAATDGQMLRAQETGKQGEVSQLTAKRQFLRDLPATVEVQLNGLSTPEALEAFQADGLT